MRVARLRLRRLALDHHVALEPREALVQELTEALPEARAIDRATHPRGKPPRVITFALLSEER